MRKKRLEGQSHRRKIPSAGLLWGLLCPHENVQPHGHKKARGKVIKSQTAAAKQSSRWANGGERGGNRPKFFLSLHQKRGRVTNVPRGRGTGRGEMKISGKGRRKVGDL